MDRRALPRIYAIVALFMAAPLAFGADPGLEERWLAFREYLPEDVRENLDRAYRGIEFERLAYVPGIEATTWCDSVAVYIPPSEEAERKWKLFWDSFGSGISQTERDQLRQEAGELTQPTIQLAEKMERDLALKCEDIEEQHPDLAPIVPRIKKDA